MDPIAVWGAVSGTLALGLHAVKSYRDEPRLELNWLRRFLVIEDNQATARRFHRGQRVARLLVTNLGRKPIRITSAYGVLERDGKVLFETFVEGADDSGQARVLSPERPSTDFLVEEGPALDKWFQVGVYDGFGKVYRLWLIGPGAERRRLAEVLSTLV
jgi:hypothetical protein